jgi:hypothetical protein
LAQRHLQAAAADHEEEVVAILGMLQERSESWEYWERHHVAGRLSMHQQPAWE